MPADLNGNAADKNNHLLLFYQRSSLFRSAAIRVEAFSHSIVARADAEI